ncbi:MAG: hypothetical protein JNG86_01875 [Verrucomicrobiaceae bacterium]|nr:hypothetical protein [Verrucomicrobiaceae bacterium]
MTRHAAFSLLFVLSPLFAGAQDAGEKKAEKPVEAEKAEKAAQEVFTPEDVRVMAFSVMEGEPLVVLSHVSGLKIIPLRFTPDQNGSRLISASVDDKKRELNVVALLDGKEHTLTQPLKSMPRVPMEALKGGFGSPPQNKVGFGGVPKSESPSEDRKGRGPSEEDRKKYESLSEKAKEKFREGMRKMFADDKFRNATEDERRTAIRALFDEIQKEDQASRPKP